MARRRSLRRNPRIMRKPTLLLHDFVGDAGPALDSLFAI
jgi:hypothetical protein